MLKIYRLFGIKFLEVEMLETEEAQKKEILKQYNPKGAILDVVPEEKEDGNQ